MACGKTVSIREEYWSAIDLIFVMPFLINGIPIGYYIGLTNQRFIVRKKKHKKDIELPLLYHVENIEIKFNEAKII